MGQQNPILKETFIVSSSPYSVFIFSHQIAWCPQRKGGEDMSEWINVKLKDVLGLECINSSSSSGDFKKTSKFQCCLPNLLKTDSKGCNIPSQHIALHYAQKKTNSDKWRKITLNLYHDDYSLLNKWFNTIQEIMKEVRGRPKNLLFFVNPYGGKRKAVSIFENLVQPILELCKVKRTVIFTERRNHATEKLKSMSADELESFDGVVAVGGDGTVCEVVSGLLYRTPGNAAADSSEFSQSVSDSDLKAVNIPIGVIGAGSTNACVYTIHGTDDPVTGIIHIVLGGSLPVDVAAVQNHSGEIIKFIVGQMSYGYLADIMLQSEELRWMGPRRYDYAGFRKFLQASSYEGSIDMKISTDETRKLPTQCTGEKGCEECNGADSKTSCEWKRVEGNFIGVSGAILSLRCPLTPMGMAPFAHLSDGHMELIVIRKASRLNHLRYLLRLAGDSRRAFALPFVERYRVDEFVFTPTQCCNNNMKTLSPAEPGSLSVSGSCSCDAKDQVKTRSLWNCDGELLYQPSVKVSVHRNLIRMMGRSGSESPNYLTFIPPQSQNEHDDNISTCPTVSTTVPMTRSPSFDIDTIGSSTNTIDQFAMSQNGNVVL